MSARESQDLPRRIADLDGQDAYDLLGITPEADRTEIVAAYKRQMARAHPDRGGSARRAQLVNCAYDVLTQYRDSYDELLELHSRVAAPDVLYIEPDVEPLDDPGPGRPGRRLGRGLLLAGALLLAVVAAVILNRADPEPEPPQAWTTTSVAPPIAAPAPAAAPSVAPAAAPPAAPAATTSLAPPAPIPPATAVVSTVSAPPSGGGHRCELHADGSLWCAGGNAYGQLGNGTTGDAAAPVRVGAPTARWSAVSVGGRSSCGLLTDRTLWCWGDNTHGQLGDGTNSSRTLPVPVDPAAHWLALDVDTHVCAVRNDHTLWCWGAGDSGELGDAGLAGQASPIQVGTDSTWAAVSVGPGWTCAVRQDGGRRCWGAAPTAG